MVVECYVENHDVIRFAIQEFQETTYHIHGNSIYLGNIIIFKSVSMWPRREKRNIISIPPLCGT